MVDNEIIRIGVLGCEGHIGRLVVKEIFDNDYWVLAGGAARGITQEYITQDYVNCADALFTSDAVKIIKISDVVIDFTAPSATVAFARLAAEHCKPFLSGTTGLTEEHMTVLRNAAQTIPVLHTVNTTPSFHEMAKGVERAAMGLAQSGCAVEIIETHREGKSDAVSGSALFLKRTVRLASGGKLDPKILSVRVDDVAGTHDVVFKSEEKILFQKRHEIKDRREFALGAIEAALWLSERKRPAGFYGMANVLRRPAINAGY